MKPSSSSVRFDDLRRDVEDAVVLSAFDRVSEASSSSARLLSDLEDTSDPFLDLPEVDFGILTDAYPQIATRGLENQFILPGNLQCDRKDMVALNCGMGSMMFGRLESNAQSQ